MLSCRVVGGHSHWWCAALAGASLALLPLLPTPPALRHGRAAAGGKFEWTGEGVSGPGRKVCACVWGGGVCGGGVACPVLLPSKSYRTCETFMEGEQRMRTDRATPHC